MFEHILVSLNINTKDNILNSEYYLILIIFLWLFSKSCMKCWYVHIMQKTFTVCILIVSLENEPRIDPGLYVFIYAMPELHAFFVFKLLFKHLQVF